MASSRRETSQGWIIQKYGGTSLGKFPENIVNIINLTTKNQRVAVVCSARSSQSKNEGTTTRLLRAANVAASDPESAAACQSIVDDIRNDHLQAARDINSPLLRKHFEDAVDAECQSLSRILESAREIEEITPKTENKIISKGEKLACRYLAALLEDRGVPSQFVDLSDIMRRYNISTDISEHYLFTELANAFGQEVLACGDKVPIITGYFGNLAGGLLKTFGRGYSDLAAALVTIGISAHELQIWKEVDGIFTADPRKVPTARLIHSISPSEVAELTFYGSEVINPHTMAQVINARIPIRIKNVMNPSGKGTFILPDSVDANDISSPKKTRFLLNEPTAVKGYSEALKYPTAVTIKHPVIVLNLCSNRKTRAHGFLAKVFQILDRNFLSVDLIASSEVHVSLALHSEHAMVSGPDDELGGEDLTIDDKRLKKAYDELGELGSVDIIAGMSIISLVGNGLKKMTSMAGRFFSVLGEAGVNIEMISQGSSEIVISCVIAERDAEKALNLVHTHLFSFLE